MPTPELTLPDELDSADLALDFSDAELSALLTPTACGPDDLHGEVAPSPELLDVTRRISVQLLDVLLVTARALFGGATQKGEVHQLISTFDALRRLAEAGRDTAARDRITAVMAEAERFLLAGHGRARERFLVRLRDWILTFAEDVGEEHSRRLRALVEYDPRDVPLFHELAAIPGIGPRRLQRLFAAGLHDVDTVAAANAQDLAAVTGLPRALAEDIIRRARAFSADESRRAVLEMRTRLDQFQRALQSLAPGAPPDLQDAARQALAQMEALVSQLSPRRHP